MLGGRSWDEWIAQYSGSHQHPVNRREERAHRLRGELLVVRSGARGVRSDDEGDRREGHQECYGVLRGGSSHSELRHRGTTFASLLLPHLRRRVGWLLLRLHDQAAARILEPDVAIVNAAIQVVAPLVLSDEGHQGDEGAWHGTRRLPQSRTYSQTAFIALQMRNGMGTCHSPG
jgi:hypothetical protein